MIIADQRSATALGSWLVLSLFFNQPGRLKNKLRFRRALDRRVRINMRRGRYGETHYFAAGRARHDDLRSML